VAPPFAQPGTRRTFSRYLNSGDLPGHLDVYGAAHMPAVTRELLRRYGYRPRTAEWLTVFGF
jgi:hypothetical protein